MDFNKMELELKHLAPYLPYKLEFQIWISENDNGIREMTSRYITSIVAYGYMKPLLRPLSQLTEEIEHNGERFVPMYEMVKTQGFSVSKIENWNFEYNDQFQPIAKATDSNWMLRYMAKEDAFFLNGLKDWNKKHQKSRRQLKMYNMLFQWHFDVFNLIPNNLAIEKK